MKNSKNTAQETILPILIRFLIFGGLLTPAVFFPPLYDIYDLSKATFLRVLTALLLTLWVADVFSSRKLKLPPKAFLIPLVSFAMVLLLSTVFSVNPLQSLVGGIKRHEGFPTFFSYIYLAIMAAIYFRPKELAVVAGLSMLVTGFVSIYGIFQRYGIDFMNFGQGPYDITRAFATTGNPVFLGAFLALAAPFFLGAFIASDKGWKHYAYGIVFVLAVACAVWTESRGAYFGVAAGAPIILIFAWDKVKNSIKRAWKPVAIGVVLIFLVLTLATKLNPNTPQRAGAIQRIVSLLQISEGSSGTRLEMWKGSIGLIEERPLLGWGLETFKNVFPRHRSLRLIKMEGEMSMPDRPHNELLYIVSSGGLLAITLYLWIFLAFSWRALSFYRKRKGSDGYLLAILAAAIGYFVANFFFSSTVNTTPVFWTLIGTGIMIMTKDRKPWTIKLPQSLYSLRYGLYGGMAVIALAITIISMRFMLGDLQYNRSRFSKFSALQYKQAQLLDIAKQEIETAVRLSPYQNIYRTEQASIYGSTSDPQAIHQIIQVFKTGIEYDSLDEDMWLNLGNAYMNLATQDQNAVMEAKKAFEKALSIDPTFSIAHSQMASIYLSMSKDKEAEDHLRQVLLVNAKEISAYTRLAQILEKRGDRQNAIDMYEKALEVDPNHQESKDNFARLTGRSKG